MFRDHWSGPSAPIDERVSAPAVRGHYHSQARELRRVGRHFHRRGWAPGTGGNYSVVIGRDPLRLMITASGSDKGRLGPDDFVVVDERGRPVSPEMPRPSAETLLHVVAASRPEVGAVLHTHSAWATVLGDLHGDPGHLEIAGYEMLKAFRGVSTHEHRLRLEVVENTQDMAALAEDLRGRLRSGMSAPGLLLRRHGLYAWGADLDEAIRHVEAFEFLFEVLVRRRAFGAASAAALDPVA